METAERRHLYELGFKVLMALMRCALFAFCVFIMGDTIKPFAGKVSYADLRLIFKADVGRYLGWAICIVFGGSGMVWGIIERELRRREVKRLTRQKIELESRLDPNRTSSGLNSNGENDEEE
ncbi:MAG: hypothetical protein WC552_09515 [Candidatus Omnitrophota bacterium]